ncbi:MAG: alginate lyase family protein [Betaproteobacteria bacterium]|nr:alginate lyase family protein [Betaproteobacteria bacterium]
MPESQYPCRFQPCLSPQFTRSIPRRPGFLFLSETRRVFDGQPVVDASRLWRYNLHYCDDLNAFEAESRRAWHEEAITKWIQNYPPGSSDGWDPYPTSLRIVNWIKSALSGASLGQRAVDSLSVQARFLEQRLEYHLLGNHLFANAKALVFAGLFFEGEEAEKWLEKGVGILSREVPEQILADGGQFERSPMYHSIALEDVLDLINVFTAYPSGIPAKWQPFSAACPGLAQHMHNWLQSMCHPDGEIAFFNDAAIGIAPSPEELERYATALLGALTATEGMSGNALRVSHLGTSGYVRSESRNAVMLMDVAPIGPDYLPGHAHADTLSFELSIFGQRVIVNGGTSRYGLGPERDAERGTPTHSTVTIDGENSSEVWAGFRVARRARPFGLKVRSDDERLEVSCAHDGYCRLRGRPVHWRTWDMMARNLRIEDRVEGQFSTAEARFHLHPAVNIDVDASGGAGELRLAGGQVVRWHAIRGNARIEESAYAPEFGRRETTRCLALDLAGGSGSCLELDW